MTRIPIKQPNWEAMVFSDENWGLGDVVWSCNPIVCWELQGYNIQWQSILWSRYVPIFGMRWSIGYIYIYVLIDGENVPFWSGDPHKNWANILEGGELRRKKHWVMGRWVEIQLLRDLWTLLTPLISRLFGGVRKNRLGSWWDVGQGKATTCSKQKGVLWLMRYNKCWFEWNKYSIETPWETLTSTLESLTCFFSVELLQEAWLKIYWLTCVYSGW